MKLIDSHCHIHDSEFFTDAEAESVYERAVEHGLAMVLVATNLESSMQAIDFASRHDDCWVTVGVHPHEASNGISGIESLLASQNNKIVGIGEIGLDFFYNNSPPQIQKDVLRAQLGLAQKYNLPVSFHVRSAFDDFWPIYDEYPGITGVLHSFTDDETNLHKGIDRGLYIGINGISTFTKDLDQQKMYSQIPIKNLILETDAPFLTPIPFRGKVNEPSFVGKIAQHLAKSRGISLDFVSEVTTANAKRLFDI